MVIFIQNYGIIYLELINIGYIINVISNQLSMFGISFFLYYLADVKFDQNKAIEENYDEELSD